MKDFYTTVSVTCPECEEQFEATCSTSGGEIDSLDVPGECPLCAYDFTWAEWKKLERQAEATIYAEIA